MYTLTKWTVEDYHQMIQAGILSDRNVELINGEIINMSPEGPIHHFLNVTIADYLRSLLESKAIISEAHPITLRDSEPEPDITIIRSPIAQYKNHHPYPEDIFWVIEISDSTLSKDLGVKKKSYASEGIREYWVIDVNNKMLKVFQNPLNNDYQICQEYKNGIVSPLAFPSLGIAVEKLIGLELE